MNPFLKKAGRAILKEVAALPIHKYKAAALALIGLLCGGDSLFFSPYPEMSLFFFTPGMIFGLIYLAKRKYDELMIAEAKAIAEEELKRQSNPLRMLPPMQSKGNNGRLSVPSPLP